MRYLQSLLGHANSKTTDIYTHITTKGFDQIKSPLDNLKIQCQLIKINGRNQDLQNYRTNRFEQRNSPLYKAINKLKK